MTRTLVPAAVLLLASLGSFSCSSDGDGDGSGGSGGSSGGAGESSGGDSGAGQSGLPSCEKQLESAKGSLIDVSLDSQVAVVLDEIPEAQRDKLAAVYLNKSDDFWLERAKRQLRHTNYRLTYRNFFYDEAEGKNMLNLPPEAVWEITFDGKPKRITTEDGHDAVAVSYRFQSALLSDAETPGSADPALADVGGEVDEPFSLPLDPEFLFQRTGYACADEDGYPLGTVEAENLYQMFDQDCEVETEEEAYCHLTHLADESCLDALASHVGRVDTQLHFARVEFDAAKACAVQVGEVTTPDLPDLAVLKEDLANNWVEYRYIPEDSCALVEQCVGGSGWRRLLLFDASIKNAGGSPLYVGKTEDGSPQHEHNVFEFSACHMHNHFRHYGDFSYGSLPGDKRAFCVESTNRHYNNVGTPLVHEFGCENQGVATGWGDTYIAGVECNWIDVTDLEIPKAGVTQDLKFVINPDKFICEGTPKLDKNGDPVFESTDYDTEAGLPVDRAQCDFSANWDANNTGREPVLLPPDGGIVTAKCKRDQAGPLRDCGLTKQEEHVECEPGAEVHVTCSVDDGDATQVLRVCDDSSKLGGIACMFHQSLGNGVVDAAGASISFTCPEARSAAEPGGTYSLYVAPIDPSEKVATVTCKAE